MSTKLITFLTTIVLFIFVGSTYGQVNNTNKGAAVIYTTGLPTGAVRLKYDSEVAINTTNGKFYRYDRTNSAWIEAGSSIGYLNSGAAPSGDPKYGGPELIINNDKELYWYYGGVWNCVNCAALGYTAGTGINITGTTITNTLPDQTVTLGSGVGILVSGSYPNFTITNDDPDQTVTITGAGISNITGTYPNFTITSTEVDGSITNEIQRIDSLYLSNDTLFISLLNDALPASAIKLTGIGSGSVTGGGIYGQSDTVSYQHLAVIDSGLTFSSTEDTAYFNIVTAPGAFGSAGYFNPDSIRLRHYDIGGSNELILNDGGVLLKTTAPDRVTIEGNDARYAADYRETYSDRSLIDKKYGDDFYLQEIDTFRVSNDTLYISLIRDSVPQSFVVLPAGSGSAINLYELDIITPLPAVDVEGSMVLKTVDVNGSKILYVSNGTDWVEGGLFLDTLNVATINIGNDQVTYAKIQEVTAERLLGNPTGSTANPSEISLGSGLGFSGTTILNTGDLSTTNEIQQIDTFEIVSNILRASLGLDGVPFKSVDLSPYLDNTDSSGYNSAFTRSGDTLFITDGLSTKFVVLPSGIVDTDDQTLSLSNDTLYISQGNSVFLGQYLDNTDSQQLSIDSSIVEGVERFEISLDSSTSIYFDVPQVTDTDNQTIDTFSITNAIISLSLQDDALPASTIDITESVQDITGTMVESNTETGIAVTYDDGTGKLNFVAVDQSITNEIQNLTYTPATGVVAIDGTGSTDATIAVMTASVRGLTPDGDGSGTDEFLREDATWGVPPGVTNLTVTGSGPTYTIDSNTGTDVVISGSGITLSESPANTLIFTATDPSLSNEGILGVGAGSGTSATLLSNTSTSSAVTINAAGILAITESTSSNGGSITLTATEVDGSISNEGVLSVGAGTGTTSLIQSNSSGSATITLTGAGITTVNESGNTITITSTEVDGSTSNELQTIANTSNSTTHTATLSNSGGSIQLAEGTGIGLATTGTALDGVVTITNSAPDQTVSITGAGISNVTGTYPNFTITSTEIDGSTTNEIQTIDTFTIVSNVLRLSLLNDGLPFSSVDLSSYLDNTDAQTLSIDSTDVGGIIERFEVSISNGNSIYIDVPQVSGSGAGQNNVGQNLGSGTGIYAGKTDTILQFKSLVEGYGIDLSNTSTEITIRADTAQLATSHDVAVVQGDIDAHELADGDLDDTNELQSLTIDSVAITGKERFLLEISDGNTVAFDVDLNTDTQDISIDSAATTGGQNFTVTLQDGGDVDFFIPTNTDNQTLILDSAIVGSVERFELEVSNGNSVFFDIPQITDTDNQSIDTFTYSSGIITLSLQDDGLPAKTIDISGVNTDNQTIDTFEIVSNVLRASLLNDGLPFSSVNLSSYLDNTDAQNLTIEGSGPTYDIAISGGTDITVQGAGIITLSETPANTLVITGTEVDGSVTNEIQDITVTGASQPFTLDLGSDATDATFTGAGITTVTRSGNDLTFTSTEVDGSITNELQTISVTGTTTATLDLSSDASDASITGAGINVVSVVGDAITITGTEIDGSISNEGSLTVAAGTGTTSIINSNTSGQTGVTITAAGINTISEVGNVITLTATEVDGSVSNEGVLGVGAGSGTSSTLLSTTSGANAVTINAAGILAITESTSANGGSITLTATEVDGSITNEIQNLTYTAATGVVAIDGTGSTDATISVMTASTRGLVPDGDGSGTDEFLREDGTWAVPPSASTDLTIGGSGPTYTIESSTGTDVTIQASGITLSESPANTLIFTAVDGSITNEIQQLDTFEINAAIISASLSSDGVPAKTLDITESVQDITGAMVSGNTETGITVTYQDSDGTIDFVADDTSPTNEIQRLDTFEIVSNVLRASLLNDGLPFSSVSLSAYLDNTDNQTLDTFEIVSNILRASNFGDGVPFKSVDLSPYLDNTDTQDLSVDSTTIGSIERFTINLVGSPSISFDVSNTTGTVTSVAATQPAAGITISGSPITGSGTLTFALANDLAGLEGQSGTGIVVRTGDGTYAQRTATVFSSVASTANLAIGNANGVSGNPLISIETDHATNKLFVQAVSTTNLDLNGTETIDGISVTNGQRVLVAGQTAQEDNGIWDVVSAGAWTRSTDANTSGKIDPGILVNVKLGSTYGGTMWRLTTVGPYTLGTTDLVFDQVFKDENTANEGVLGVSAGASNTSVIISNTTGATGVTVTAGTALTISESTSSNGGTITLNADTTILATIHDVSLATTTEDSTFAIAGPLYTGKTLTNQVYRTGKTFLGAAPGFWEKNYNATYGYVVDSTRLSIKANSTSNNAPGLYLTNTSASFSPITWQLDSTSAPAASPVSFFSAYFPAASTAGDNTTHGWGFNTGSNGGRLIPSKAQAYIQFEENFAANTTRGDIEAHMDFFPSASGEYRPWYFTAGDSIGDNSVGSMSGNTLYFSTGPTNLNKGIWSTDQLIVQNPTTNGTSYLTVKGSGTGSSVFQMRNPTGGASLNILTLANGSDFIQISESAKNARFGGQVFSMDYPNSGNAIISSRYNSGSPNDTLNFGYYSGFGVSYTGHSNYRFTHSDGGGIYFGTHGNVISDYGVIGAVNAGDVFINTDRVSGTTSVASIGIDQTTGNVGIQKALNTIGSGGALQVLGHVSIENSGTASELRINEPSASGTNYSGFKAQAQSGNVVYTLPAASGTAGQQLTWNSSDILTWESAGGSTTNIYNSDGDIKDGGTVVDVSGNDPIILALDNATTEQNRMLRLTFDHTDDVTNTYGISFVGPNDSLEIRSYDSGMYLDYEGVTASGEGFVISSNTILDLRGDSILISTPPTRTILHHLLGIYNPMAPQTVSQIEGTANGDILVWNETGGYWEIGTASGGLSDGDYGDIDVTSGGTVLTVDTSSVNNVKLASGTGGIYKGDGTIASAATATLTGSSYFVIDFNGGADAFKVDDGGDITLTTKSNSQIFLNYSGSQGVVVDDANSAATMFSENGSQYVSVGDDEVSVMLDAAPSVDHLASGTKITLLANENQAFGDVCYIAADGDAALADADGIATAKVTVMCLSTVTTGNTGTYLLMGVVRDDSWAWTVGEHVYLSTTGTTGNTLTQTQPSGTDDCVVFVGLAIHSDRILFSPSPVIIELN